MATVTKDFRIKSGLVVEGTTGTINGNAILTTADTTSAVDEGTNLYYTNERVDDRVANLVSGGTGITISYDDNGNALGISTEFAEFDTDEITEGETNLFYTDARVDAYINQGIDTDDVSEGETNLYFTEQRAIDAVGGSATSENTPNTVVKRDANGDFAAGEVTLTQLNLGNTGTQIYEGSGNLVIEGGPMDGISINGYNGVQITSGSGDIVLNPDGDAYLGSAISGNEITTKSDIDALTTSDIEEGTNLYFTDQRAIDAVSDAVQTLTNKTMGDDLLMDGFQISGLGEPTQADHAATKSYVDSVSQGLHVKEGVDAATTDTLAVLSGGTVTYDNGTDGVNATLTLSVALTSIDDWPLSNQDRILVKGETEPAYNGIYIRTSSTVLTRDPLFDSDEEIEGGDFVFVVDGTQNGGTGWVQSSTVNNVGVDDMVWVQFSGQGTYLAGNGLILTDSTFSIDTSITATHTFVADAVSDHSDLETGVHGVTGDVVGTTDSQELSNKTFKGKAYFQSSGGVGGTDDNINVDSSGKMIVSAGSEGIELASTDGDIKLISGTGDVILNAGGDVYVSSASAGNEVATKSYVDGQTTTDIAEGTNLYFTNSRAVTALQAVVPVFTEVDINSIAKQVAATHTTTTTSSEVVYAFSDIYRSAKLLVKLAHGTHTEITEILLTLDTADNIAITEYAVVGANGALGDISASFNGISNEVEITVASVSSSTVVKVVGTIIK